MITRNPNVGRHAVGSPIAKSGTKAPKRTGRASGSGDNRGYGTGINKKSSSPGKYSGAQPRSGVNSQGETWLNQAPAPWDNSQPSSHPGKYQTSSKPDFGYTQFEVTSGLKSGGSGGKGKQPDSNFPAAAAGPKGGLGQENGNVVGKSQPRRKGNVYNQPRGSSAGGYSGRGGAPSFYGR